MIRIAERDENYVYMYSEDPEEIEYLKSRTMMIFEDNYKGYPAILVRKETRKKHVG